MRLDLGRSAAAAANNASTTSWVDDAVSATGLGESLSVNTRGFVVLRGYRRCRELQHLVLALVEKSKSLQ